MSQSSAAGPSSQDLSRYDQLDRLAEEFIERYRRGERPPLREYTERHPALAEEIRDLFPALVHIEQVEGDLRISAGKKGGPDPAAEAPAPPRRVGDFEIIREVGRGGMGVVYEAEQVSLGRRVALKILARHPAGDASALGRFRREARAAARLHHTNIVPVFEVGQDGDIFFYAMQFIEGQGLDRVIRELRRIRAIERREGLHRDRADTIVAPIGPGPPRRGLAAALQVSRVANSLLTGRFSPEAWARDVDGGSDSSSDAGAAPYGSPAVTENTAFLSTELIEGWRSGSSADAAGPAGGSAEADPVSSGLLVSAAGLLSTGESSLRPYYLGIARIGRQAAEALAYAHERGIIHRDIKPSNLLLDSAGVIWITDFGLAKADDDGLSHTGDIMGTFRYMAPERFRGEGDERADVYALGLTLYELLTLRPAFLSTDRLRLMEEIKNEEPARPRAVDPRIPRDLETIVLKAIEKEPRRRYWTAAALAEDLRRFGDDEPIVARPTGWLERLRLWCRRNQAKASLLAAAAAAVVIAFVAITWGWLVAEGARRQAAERAVTEAVARQQAESALRQFEAQQKRADDDLARALATVDLCLAKLGESRILRGPGLAPLRRELLRSALRSYEEFIRDRGADTVVRAGLASAYLRVCRIRTLLGESDEARRAAAQAIHLYRALAAEYPEDREIAAGLAEGYALDSQFRPAFRIATQLIQAEPANPRLTALALEICQAAVRHYEAAGSPADALAFLETALKLLESRVAADPRDAEARLELAETLDGLGLNLAIQGRHADALAAFRKAIGHARPAGAESPRDINFGRCLAMAWHHAGLMEQRSGRHEDAALSFSRAIDVREPLADDNPAVPFLHSALSHEYASLSACQSALGRRGEAERSLRRARDAIDRLPRRGGNRLFTLACVHAGLAALIGEAGAAPTAGDAAERRRRVGLALESLREAVAAGYDDIAQLETSPDLAPLRDRPEFREIMARLREKSREKVSDRDPSAR